jgi:hypothetical protein
VNWFCDKETIWQENEVPDAYATLALAVKVMFELEILFARVIRFWICSWEKVLFAVDNLWKFLAIVDVETNLFHLGPFHPGGYPIN